MLWGDLTHRSHDFGAVVSGPGLELRHTYRLENTSDRPLRIVRAINMKSCCGRVRLEPGLLPPGEHTTLEVFLRVDRTTGPITHIAAVETDQPGAEPLEFWTSATAYPRVRIEAASQGIPRLLPNEQTRQEFVAHAYGTEAEPPLPLEETTLESSLAVDWQGPVNERVLDDGLIEHSRRFTVHLTASAADPLGGRSAEIRLKDGDEILRRHPVRWEVVPAIRVVPPGVVVTAAEASIERRVRLWSRDGRAFQIVDIASQLPGVSAEVEPADSANQVEQTIRLTIQPGPDNIGRSGNVSFTTDRPGQPNLDVTIYVRGTTLVGEGKE